MVRIISDTSAMYSTAQAKEAGFDVAPLVMTIAGESYRELEEMNTETFVAMIREGNMPKSSQPSPGEIMELFERYKGEEVLYLSLAEGLSGAYSSIAAMARMCEETDVVVYNTQTLCGPHRLMTETAVRLAHEGLNRAQIIAQLDEIKKHMKSFLMPADFDYLRRGGRLSPLVSFVGKTIRLVPVITQTEDGKQLITSAIKRNFNQAVEHIASHFEKMSVGEGWRIYITHAQAKELACKAEQLIGERFPSASLEVYPLTPAFVTQGGPGCVAIQAVKPISSRTASF